MSENHYLQWVDKNLEERQKFFDQMKLDIFARKFEMLSNQEKLSDPPQQTARGRKRFREAESTEDVATMSSELSEVLSVPVEEEGSVRRVGPDFPIQYEAGSVVTTRLPSTRVVHRPCIDVHPSEWAIITAVGDYKTVFVQVESTTRIQRLPFVLGTSSRRVVDVAFSGHSNLLAATADGYVYKMDLMRLDAGFTKLCSPRKNSLVDSQATRCSVASANEIWLSLTDGRIVRFDTREHRASPMKGFRVARTPVYSVSVNIYSSLICTGTKELDLWDRRRLMGGPLARASLASDRHSTRAGSLRAHLHPVNPQVVLSSAGKSVQTWQWNGRSDGLKLVETFFNDNLNVKMAEAKWHPTSINPLIFALGYGWFNGGLLLYSSKQSQKPGEMPVFDVNQVRHPLLQHSQLALAAFHPSLPVVVAANNKITTCVFHVIHLRRTS